MDDKSLEILEFPKIREIIADFTSFSVSRDLALNLKPSSDPELVSLLLRQSAEARRLLSLRPGFSIGDVFDVREIVHMAARGMVLEPRNLIDIQMTLAAARNLRTSLGKLAERIPSLWSIAEQIVELRTLEDIIRKCIAPTGGVLDSASTKLASLRRQLKETRQKLLNRLETIIKSPRGRRIVQEPIITDREGRYVIPVKVELRKEIRGIVHDVSGSGATVFIEPWATVELGNELRQLIVEERHEVERILATLSAEVGANEAAISQNVALVAELELALAKARYAERANATESLITTADKNGKESLGSKAGLLRLVNARHPLLKGKVVPLSVEIGHDFSILVITGANTGGKTVALKTIGLLTLMTQAGIPIPASETSCIPVFDNIFADIGDEQSIEQTLSTFSWHMGNIVRVIQSSTERSLVLLDELVGSTDPNEGAALAQAILLHFLSRQIMVVTTTHYSDLKVFAHTTAGLQNASLDFDPITLEPTYHLTMGVPGGSNAMVIASQLGLPSEIITTAKSMMVEDAQEIEILLRDLRGEKQGITALRNELEKEKGDAEDSRKQLQYELRRLRAQEQNILQEARDRLARKAAELQKQIREAESELRKVKSREKIDQAKKALTAIREEISSQTWQAGHEDTMEEEAEECNIAIGDKVWLRDIGLWGTVLSLGENGNELEIQLGNCKVKLGIEEVKKAEPFEEEAPLETATVKRGPSGRRRSLELDLRGKRADEIAPELDSYLNDAFLAHLGQVRIIHGIGTGTVRQITRDILSSHPLVKSFRPGERGEGGDGVTVVNLSSP